MTQPTQLFFKDKYLDILKKQGLTAAVTTLHHDMEQWEQLTFEGREGYQPHLWQELEQARSFSNQLWNGAADLDFNSRKSSG